MGGDPCADGHGVDRASHTDPVPAVSGPASTVYFLFIILSVPRLGFTLGRFTGAVCSIADGVIAPCVDEKFIVNKSG